MSAIEEEPFRLYNDTLLRGFLCNLQAKIRKLAALQFEAENHPCNTPAASAERAETSRRAEMRKEWQALSDALVIVLGPEAELRNFNALAQPGSFAKDCNISGEDPFRITMKALKLRADKARRKHPELTLLKSWDIAARERPKPIDV